MGKILKMENTRNWPWGNREKCWWAQVIILIKVRLLVPSGSSEKHISQEFVQTKNTPWPHFKISVLEYKSSTAFLLHTLQYYPNAGLKLTRFAVFSLYLFSIKKFKKKTHLKKHLLKFWNALSNLRVEGTSILVTRK